MATDWEQRYRVKKATGEYCAASGCDRLLYPTGSPQFCDDHSTRDTMHFPSSYVLYKTLVVLNKVADHGSSLGALAYVRIEAADGVATLTTLNLNQRLTTTTPVEGEGTVCLPARALTKLARVKRADDGPLTVEVLERDEASVHVGGTTERLDTLRPKDFPDMHKALGGPFEPIAEWPTAAFRAPLAYTLPAVCRNATRTSILCLALLGDRMVATDGHRMHMAPLPSTLDAPIRIPPLAAHLLPRLLGYGDTVTLVGSRHALQLTVGDWELVTGLHEVPYPPVDQVWPARPNVRLTVGHETLTQTLKGLKELNPDETAVLMTVTDVDRIELLSGTDAIALDLIRSNYRDAGFTIGLSIDYLIEALGKAGDVVTLLLDGPLDPLVVHTGNNCKGLVMPMRL